MLQICADCYNFIKSNNLYYRKATFPQRFPQELWKSVDNLLDLFTKLKIKGLWIFYHFEFKS